jgi:hypothetical protein
MPYSEHEIRNMKEELYSGLAPVTSISGMPPEGCEK